MGRFVIGGNGTVSWALNILGWAFLWSFGPATNWYTPRLGMRLSQSRRRISEVIADPTISETVKIQVVQLIRDQWWKGIKAIIPLLIAVLVSGAITTALQDKNAVESAFLQRGFSL